MKPTLLMIGSYAAWATDELEANYTVIKLWEAEDRDGIINAHCDAIRVIATRGELGASADLEVLKPRGVLVQLGLGGDVSTPQNVVVAKEIEMRSTFRFHEDFPSRSTSSTGEPST